MKRIKNIVFLLVFFIVIFSFNKLENAYEVINHYEDNESWLNWYTDRSEVVITNGTTYDFCNKVNYPWDYYTYCDDNGDIKSGSYVKDYFDKVSDYEIEKISGDDIKAEVNGSHVTFYTDSTPYMGNGSNSNITGEYRIRLYSNSYSYDWNSYYDEYGNYIVTETMTYRDYLDFYIRLVPFTINYNNTSTLWSGSGFDDRVYLKVGETANIFSCDYELDAYPMINIDGNSYPVNNICPVLEDAGNKIISLGYNGCAWQGAAMIFSNTDAIQNIRITPRVINIMVGDTATISNNFEGDFSYENIDGNQYYWYFPKWKVENSTIASATDLVGRNGITYNNTVTIKGNKIGQTKIVYGLLDGYYEEALINVTDTKTGIFYDKATGDYYLYENGVKQTSYTGLYNDLSDENISYNIKNGRLQQTTGLLTIDGTKLYAFNGIIDFTYEGLIEYNNQRLYVKDGMVSYKENLTVFKGGDAYLIENSQVVKIIPRNVNCAMTINGIKRAVVDSVVQYDYVGVVADEQGIWYFVNGEVPYNYTGISAYIGDIDAFYYIEHGMVSNVTGLINIDGMITYFKDGIADYQTYGVYQDNTGFYYIEHGVVTFETNTTYRAHNMLDYIVEDSRVIMTVNRGTTGAYLINDKWRYLHDSFVQYDYTGIGGNEYGIWYFENGELQRNYTGLSNYIPSHDCFYYILNGKVAAINGLNNVEGTIIYFQNGTVNYKYCGLAPYNGKNYYVTSSVVMFDEFLTYFDTKGMAHIIENSEEVAVFSGWTSGVYSINGKLRYLINSEVQYNYNGIAYDYINDQGYYFKNGLVQTSFTGEIKDNNGETVYIRNGRVVKSLIETIAIDRALMVIKAGVTEQIKYTLEPNVSNYTNIGYLSSNTTLVKVDQTGKVTGLKEGFASIRVYDTKGDAYANCNVLVIGNTINLKGIGCDYFIKLNDRTKVSEVKVLNGLPLVSGYSYKVKDVDNNLLGNTELVKYSDYLEISNSANQAKLGFIISGDTNHDGKCTLYDTYIVIKDTVGSKPISEEQKIARDYNEDNKVTLSDAVKFIQKVLK